MNVGDMVFVWCIYVYCKMVGFVWDVLVVFVVELCIVVG